VKRNEKNALIVPSWLERPGVLSYIVDCYVGTENITGTKRPRRVFKWTDENGLPYKGNVEAFVLHMGLKFGLNLSPAYASLVHAILREMGEVVLPTKKNREARKPDSPLKGKFRQPRPDKWRAR
jgi:hypothetical protein